MKYEVLRGYFEEFHRGGMSRLELVAAIALWQAGGARI
jgi:hypothetical protein